MPQQGTARMDADLFAAFCARVIERLPRDMDPTIAQGHIDNPSALAKLLREALMPPDEKPATPPYLVTVDYGMSLADMIAAGRYDWTNSDITAKHFPVKGEGKAEVEIQLVHFDRVMGSDDVIRELDKMGLRPAAIEELLAFGAKYPDVQREFPIVALKSVWRSAFGYRYVACLSGDGSGRDLHLRWFGFGWSEFCRFAAVRK